MAIEFQKIDTLDQVNFDVLLEASFPDIDINYFSAYPNLLTHDQKKEHYYNRVYEATQGASPIQKEGETFMMVKIVVDGVDSLLKAGFIESGGDTFRIAWYLAKPDSTGNRKWIYTPETDAARKQFYTSQNLTHYKGAGINSSILIKAMRRNIANTFITLEEENTHLYDSVGNIVELKIRV